MISANQALCRKAVDADIPTVARIHQDAFAGFFLTKLGFNFLRLMYRVFLLNPAGIFVVCESTDGKVIGFAVGALKSGKKDRWLALRFLPQFLLAAIPAILRHPQTVVKRLVARFFETDPSFHMPNDAAILRSIGVLNSARGGKAAYALLDAFEQMALRKGAAYVYLTTDQNNNERAQNFYKRNHYEVAECFQQDGRRAMWLMSKPLRSVVNE